MNMSFLLVAKDFRPIFYIGPSVVSIREQPLYWRGLVDNVNINNLNISTLIPQKPIMNWNT